MANVQLLGIALTAPFLVVLIRMVRQRRLRAKYSFLWLVVGGTILALSLVPGLMLHLADAAGILYPPALLFLGAIMLLMFLSVHFSWELSRIEDRMRTIAEELALARARLDELEGPPEKSVDESTATTGASIG